MYSVHVRVHVLVTLVRTLSVRVSMLISLLASVARLRARLGLDSSRLAHFSALRVAAILPFISRPSPTIEPHHLALPSSSTIGGKN